MIGNIKDTSNARATSKIESQTVAVLTRFNRDELEQIKADTGASAAATAIACFVRKDLRKRV